MENLYHTTEMAKDYLSDIDSESQSKNSYLKSFRKLYYEEFLIKKIYQLIMDTIEDLEIKGTENLDIICKRNINSLSDVRVCKTIEASIVRDDSSDTIIVSPRTQFTNFIGSVVSFIRSNKLGDVDYYSGDHANININTNLKSLIDAFYGELQRIEQSIQTLDKSAVKKHVKIGKRLDNMLKKHVKIGKRLDNMYEYGQGVIDGINSSISDILHSYYFEKGFLDSVFINMIKQAIRKAIHIRNFTIDNQDIVISTNFTMGKKTLYPIDDMFFSSFVKLVKQFIDDYDLGQCYINEFYETLNISISATLSKLMDAYYMEKQRIEHYTSGDYLVTEANPNAKRLK